MTLHTNSGSPSSHWTANVKTLERERRESTEARRKVVARNSELSGENAELQEELKASEEQRMRVVQDWKDKVNEVSTLKAANGKFMAEVKRLRQDLDEQVKDNHARSNIIDTQAKQNADLKEALDKIAIILNQQEDEELYEYEPEVSVHEMRANFAEGQLDEIRKILDGVN